jgi:hypothetical protein
LAQQKWPCGQRNFPHQTACPEHVAFVNQTPHFVNFQFRISGTTQGDPQGLFFMARYDQSTAFYADIPSRSV